MLCEPEVRVIASVCFRLGCDDFPSADTAGVTTMLRRMLHLLVLATLAFSLVLLIALSESPTFFTAHSSSPGQIVAFALVVALVPAFVLSVVMLAAHAFSVRLGLYVFRGFLAVLTFLFVVQVVDVFGGLVWLVTAFAVAVTYGLMILYVRDDQLRSAVSVLAVLPPVVVVYFLFFSATSSVIFPDDVEAVTFETLLGIDLENVLGGVVDIQDRPDSAASADPEPNNTTAGRDDPDNAAASPGNTDQASLVERLNERFPPIYLLVFDELPWYSLLDESGRIDPVRYPNFARFAGTAHVFNNATTNGSSTEVSVPVMLASSLESHSAPVYSMYPDNLFTLLGGVYDVSARDPIVDLCPVSVCNGSTPLQVLDLVAADNTSPAAPVPALRNDETYSSGETYADGSGSLSLLFEDAAVLFGHLVTPEGMDFGLPSVTTVWGNFGNNRLFDYRGDIAAIHPRDLPRLHYLHTLLPHGPWRLRPNGSIYPVIGVPGYTTNTAVWDDDVLKARFGQQRHLLQLGFTDRLLGEYLDRLEEIGDFDRAMVIVTADHGITFVAGERPRGDIQNVGGVAGVPLLFKEPYQTSGTVQSRPVQLIDIVPTIAALLGVDAPWDLAGRDMLRAQPEVDRAVLVGGSLVWVPEDFTMITEELAADMHEVFGDGTSGSLYGLGGAHDLIGFPARDRATNRSVHCWIKERPTAIPEPGGAIGYVYGSINATPGASIAFAIVVDGIVAGTARSFEDGPAHRVFAIGDSQYWQGQEPAVELHEIVGSRLAPIPSC